MHALDLEIIVLAAGLSRRMGEFNKLLMPIEGEPLIRRSIRRYLSCSNRVVVVLGHQAEQIRGALDGLDVSFIFNPHYEIGQQTSVRLGLANARADGEAVMMGLADQPLLDETDLSDFISSFARSDKTRIFIPYHEGERGNPVLLPGAIARRLQKDVRNPTCRRFIDNHPDLTHRYEAPNSHFTTNIDTPEDAHRLGIHPRGSETPIQKTGKRLIDENFG